MIGNFSAGQLKDAQENRDLNRGSSLGWGFYQLFNSHPKKINSFAFENAGIPGDYTSTVLGEARQESEPKRLMECFCGGIHGHFHPCSIVSIHAGAELAFREDLNLPKILIDGYLITCDAYDVQRRRRDGRGRLRRVRGINTKGTSPKSFLFSFHFFPVPCHRFVVRGGMGWLTLTS